MKNRPALTLVEVILVLALLVVISAIAVPLLAGSYSHARLNNGGELLRAAWGRARISAMQAGETYVFRFAPKGSRYQIATLSSFTTKGAAPDTSAADSGNDGDYSDGDVLRLSLSRLPEGVVFSDAQLADVPQMAEAAASDSGWSAPILFYADGTTTDAVVLLANDRDRTLRVTLRGLTGISRTSEAAP